MRGKFITFEGAEGSGKSTQARMVYEYLQNKRKSVLHIREPGGVKISEKIRDILLDIRNTKMCNECEVLLYMAARAQLVHEVIFPALKKGKIVLCDRFLDSTLVYQGFGNGVSMDIIRKIGIFATKEIMPDLTIIFDIEAKKGLSRTGQMKDRIEQRSLAYHNRVRQGYLQLAQVEPQRIKLIKVRNHDKDAIQKKVRKCIDEVLGI